MSATFRPCVCYFLTSAHRPLWLLLSLRNTRSLRRHREAMTCWGETSCSRHRQLCERPCRSKSCKTLVRAGVCLQSAHETTAASLNCGLSLPHDRPGRNGPLERRQPHHNVGVARVAAVRGICSRHLWCWARPTDSYGRSLDQLFSSSVWCNVRFYLSLQTLWGCVATGC